MMGPIVPPDDIAKALDILKGMVPVLDTSSLEVMSNLYQEFLDAINAELERRHEAQGDSSQPGSEA
jgi:hypothetical protein